MVKTWMGDTNCNLCNIQLKPDLAVLLIDGATNEGPWAVMCRYCHSNYGVGLGTGRGQLYVGNGTEFVKYTAPPALPCDHLGKSEFVSPQLYNEGDKYHCGRCGRYFFVDPLTDEGKFLG